MFCTDSSPDIILVFLDKEEDKLYQLRQWIQPMERLKCSLSVGVWYSSEYAGHILAGTKLQTIYLRNLDSVFEHLKKHPAKVYLYVNQSALNFQVLRDGRGIHVFISHGESDKAYMYQNTIKRFDLCFAAGETAIKRLAQHVAGYDVAKRVVTIGRPQILDHHKVPEDFPLSTLPRVFYAPTWEGVTRVTNYSSIHSHGLELVRSLFESRKFQVIYRPHPMAGRRDALVRDADGEIKQLIEKINKSIPEPIHYVDTSSFGWQLEALDVMVTDISAVAYDWLATGKALLLTRPTDEKAVVTDFPLIRALHPLESTQVGRTAELVDQALIEAACDQSPLVELLHCYYGNHAESDDVRFENEIRKAIRLQSTIPLAATEWSPQRSGTDNTRSRILRRCNTIARRLMERVGIWNTTVPVDKITQEFSALYIHFSDPFDTKSLKGCSEILDDILVADTGTLIIGTNQVTTWFYLNVLIWFKIFRSRKHDIDIRVLPIPTPSACEHVIEMLKPASIRYLKHHRFNQMMLRINGVNHELFFPETDPRFEPDHTLVVYDSVRTLDEATRRMVSQLLAVSCPKLG